MQNITIQDAQPKSLYLLFFTELWERFGFYTIQAIIILYMTKALLMTDHHANLLYAAMSSLLYLTPTLGGYLADRYLGFQRAITLGGVLFIVAYLVAAFKSQTLFFLGLSILICANGFFKPNVSSIVGELYKENDPRRDGGFTIFYMGINVGALIPPLIAGALVLKFGWHSGFIVAAIGMAIGQLIFMFGKKYLGTAGLYPVGRQSTKPLGKLFYAILSIGIIACIGVCQLAFHYPEMTSVMVQAAAVIVFLAVVYFLMKEPVLQRKKMIASLVLIVISFGFWAFYNQAFTSLTLFADRNMTHRMLGLPIDAEATQFFNPFFIIMLSPLLSRLWIRMDHAEINPSIQMKFSLGVLFLAVGFLLLAFSATFLSVHGQISPWWLCGSYLLQTVGELLISPIGLAMITVLCPKHLVGMMMGVWFFSQAASFAVGGFIANLAAVPDNLPAVQSLPIYAHAFMIYGGISLVLTLLSFALVPFLNRMIKN